jgi:hypothetical protein
MVPAGIPILGVSVIGIIMLCLCDDVKGAN